MAPNLYRAATSRGKGVPETLRTRICAGARHVLHLAGNALSWDASGFMILYSLRCAAGHEFEAWFHDSSAFDAQSSRGQIECPACGTVKVEKALMAPSIAKTKSERHPVAAPGPSGGPAEFEALAAKLRAHVEQNFDYVGEKFAEEARAIHFGEKEERPIYGEASAAEAKALNDEGVKVAPLPGLKKPRARMN